MLLLGPCALSYINAVKRIQYQSPNARTEQQGPYLYEDVRIAKHI